MDWISSLQNSQAEALTLNVTVCRGGAFTKVIKVAWGHIAEALIQKNCCPYKKGKRQESTHTQERPWEAAVRRHHLQAQESSKNYPGQHLDVGLPVSGTVRKYFSVGWVSQSVVFFYGGLSWLICTVWWQKLGLRSEADPSSAHSSCLLFGK